MIYKCQSCGEEFREPDRKSYEEPSEFWGAPVSETFVVEMCPRCASEDIEEVNECIVCGHATDDIFKYYCSDCHDEIGKYLEQIQETFGIDHEQLKDFISEHFEF